jgi:hypothetical protein
MDTSETARIHRRIGLLLLLQRLYFRLGASLAGFVYPPQGQSRVRYLQGRGLALNALIGQYLHANINLPSSVPGVLEGAQPWDLFAQLPKREYRPCRLPISVDVFAPLHSVHKRRMLWKFYARAGVRLHPIFDKHHDFYKPELVGELAVALESALKRFEDPSM